LLTFKLNIRANKPLIFLATKGFIQLSTNRIQWYSVIVGLMFVEKDLDWTTVLHPTESILLAKLYIL
jgi:hypothetical protein